MILIHTFVCTVWQLKGRGIVLLETGQVFFLEKTLFLHLFVFFCWLVLGKFCENLPFVHTLLVYLEIVFLHVHLSEVISQCVCCKTNYTVLA